MYFHIIKSRWHNWVVGGSNSKHYMLYFHWEFIDSKLSKIQGILQTSMLSPLLLTHIFGCYEKKEGNNSRHFMFDFPLFMVFTSADSYLSTNYKYHTFYVISSCIFTMDNISDTQQYHYWNMMFDFSLIYSTISWLKVANILYKVILNLFDYNFITMTKIYVRIDGPYINFWSTI